MTSSEDFEAEMIRLVREYPLFPLFVIYGLEYLSQRLELLSDSDIFTMFGGCYDPDTIKSDLERIKALLNDSERHDSAPYS